MIIIQIPPTYSQERHYILSVLFGEFLGLEYEIQPDNRYDVRITTSDEKEFLVYDGLFSVSEAQWLQQTSLPAQPLDIFNLTRTSLTSVTVSAQVPVIYGDKLYAPDFLELTENQIRLGVDIFGSAFFMMTCYEELVKQDRDKHNRFPATSSLAYQEGFLNRPIINEYLEILWSCLKHLWPNLERKERVFNILPSHDVDEPFLFAVSGISRLIRRCGGSLLKRHSPLQVLKDIMYWLRVKTGNVGVDPFNTFDLIMDMSEKNNLQSAFYFITQHSAGRIDGVYNIDHPLIRNLMKKIHERGHEIGLHTSYNTYQDALRTKEEFACLKQVCSNEGIEQSTWGGRQHFLRWETPTTFQNWEDAALDYDSTLSYADYCGFRCGVCWDFTVFNLKTRRTLKLKERPLIVMDRTILASSYLDLTHKQALQEISILKDHCKMFNGNFTILWHNDGLVNKQDIELFQDIIKKT